MFFSHESGKLYTPKRKVAAITSRTQNPTITTTKNSRTKTTKTKYNVDDKKRPPFQSQVGRRQGHGRDREQRQRGDRACRVARSLRIWDQGAGVGRGNRRLGGRGRRWRDCPVRKGAGGGGVRGLGFSIGSVGVTPSHADGHQNWDRNKKDDVV